MFVLLRQVYIGAPNIREFAPGPKSFIDIREFKTPESLAERIRFLASEPEQYEVRAMAQCHCFRMM